MLLKFGLAVVTLVDTSRTVDDGIHLNVIDLALVEVSGLRSVPQSGAPFGLEKNDVAVVIARHQVTFRPALVTQARRRESNERGHFHYVRTKRIGSIITGHTPQCV